MFVPHFFSTVFLSGKRDGNFMMNLIIFHFSCSPLIPLFHCVMWYSNSVMEYIYCWPIHFVNRLYWIFPNNCLWIISHTCESRLQHLCFLLRRQQENVDIKTYRGLKNHSSALFRVRRSRTICVLSVHYEVRLMISLWLKMSSKQHTFQSSGYRIITLCKVLQRENCRLG